MHVAVHKPFASLQLAGSRTAEILNELLDVYEAMRRSIKAALKLCEAPDFIELDAI